MSMEEHCVELVFDSAPDVGPAIEHQCRKRATAGTKYCSQHRKQRPGEVITLSGTRSG